ncbi:MAG: hypothetical protein WDN28_00925 [Chthoniobacter sp.]
MNFALIPVPAPRGDDRLAAPERGLQAVADFQPRIGVSFSSPGVGHVLKGLNSQFLVLSRKENRQQSASSPRGKAFVRF